MKKYLFISLAFLLLVVSACSSDNSSGASSSSSVIELQGFELNVPRGFDCSGGFTDGFRFFDAECLPSRGAYKIVVDYGLPTTRVDTSQSLSEYMVINRGFTYDGSCFVYDELLVEGAEHYVCTHIKSGEKVISLGTVHSPSRGIAVWFESHLVVIDDELSNDDYLDILADFVSRAVVIDWSNFAS